MTSGASAGMNTEQFRKALYERMHDRGVLDSLKSQLRNFMVSELSGEGSLLNKRDNRHLPKSSLQKKVLDSLIYKYLLDVNCDYSVGVFLPEVGLSKREIITEEELKGLLHIRSQGPESGKPLLLQIIKKYINSVDNHEQTTSTQTDHDPEGFLMDKLSRIDEEFKRKQPSSSALSIEERLLSYQQQIDKQAKDKYEEEINRWKKIELEAITATEREKNQRELTQLKNKLEEEYRKKIMSVSERERSLADSVKSEYEVVQRETYQQRQQLLQQSEQLRAREAELRDQREHTSRLQRINEEKVQQLEQQIKRREQEVQSRELHLDNTLRTHQERIKLETQVSYESKYRELKAWECNVKDKEMGVEREKRTLLTENERKELLDKRIKCTELDSLNRKYCLDIASLEMKIDSLQQQAAKVYDYEVLRDSNVSLKKDLELTKDRLEAVIREKAAIQEKYERITIDGRSRAGTEELLIIKSQIQRERDRALDDKVLLEHKLREVEVKFNEQINKNRALLSEFDTQTERQRMMNKEQTEIRTQLSKSDSPRRTRSQGGDLSYYDTSFRKTLPPELALDADWPEADSNEVSTATEDSIITDTRKRLKSLTTEADNLHSAFRSFNRQPGNSPNKDTSSMFVKSAPIRSPDRQTANQNFSWSQRDAPSFPTRPTTAPYEQAQPGYTESRRIIDSGSHRGGILSQADQFNRPTPNKEFHNPISIKPEVRFAEPEKGTPAPPNLPVTSKPPTEANFSQPINQPASIYQTFNQTSPQCQPTNQMPPLYQSTNQTARSYQMENQTTNPIQAVTDSTNQMQFSSASDQSGAKPVTLEDLSPIEPHLAPSPAGNLAPEEPTKLPSTPASLDDAWKSTTHSKPADQKLGSSVEPVSLDSQWKQQTSTLDEAWKTQTIVTDESSSKTAETKTTEPVTVVEAATAEKAKEESSDDIDPVMLKYMQMVKERRENAAVQPKETVPVKSEAKLESRGVKDFLADDSISEELVSQAKSDNSDTAADDDFW